MSGASKKLLPSWRETADSLGFGVLCIRSPEGERFTFALTKDMAKIPIAALLSESELRHQVARAGFSQADIDTGIQVARAWATTVTRTSNRPTTEKSN